MKREPSGKVTASLHGDRWALIELALEAWGKAHPTACDSALFQSAKNTATEAAKLGKPA